MKTLTPEDRAKNLTRREARKAGIHLPRKQNRSPLKVLKDRVKEHNKLRHEQGSNYSLKVIGGEIVQVETKKSRLKREREDRVRDAKRDSKSSVRKTWKMSY